MTTILLSERIDEWIQQQLDQGKTREELHNAHFVGKDSVGVIKKYGKKGFNLEIYYEPKVVFFDE